METPPLFHALWFRASCGLVIGLCLGSFITMLSYRLPRRLSIVRPRSYCPSCRTILRPIELIPVLSWMLQRGRCRHCGDTIRPRYPLIEIVTALLMMAAFALIGFSFSLALAATGIVLFMTAGVMVLER